MTTDRFQVFLLFIAPFLVGIPQTLLQPFELIFLLRGPHGLRMLRDIEGDGSRTNWNPEGVFVFHGALFLDGVLYKVSTCAVL